MEPLEEAVPERLAQAEIDSAVSVARRVTENIRRAVEVKSEVLEHVTVSLLAEGHILVEDYPGVGKTALARALSRSIDCAFARVQCTADLLPADIVGSQIYNQREGRFEFRPGPIFANVVIVDEVNRASPKTQSGLLECMQERHVTVDAGDGRLRGPNGPHLGDRPEIEDAVVSGVLLEHLGLVDGAGVTERDADHEPIQLRLGKRVSALVLSRILRGDDDERPRELVLVAVDGDVALLHALEQARLRLW